MLKPRIRANLICWRCGASAKVLAMPTGFTIAMPTGFTIICDGCHLRLVNGKTREFLMDNYYRNFGPRNTYWKTIPRERWNYA